MKRHTTIFILFAYLLFSSGVSISMHYCGDQLTSLGFFATNKGCACGKSDKEAHDCCKDVQIECAKDDQKASALYKINIEKVVLSEISFYIVQFYRLNKNISIISFLDYHSPPFYKVPKFIFNQIFRL